MKYRWWHCTDAVPNPREPRYSSRKEVADYLGRALRPAFRSTLGMRAHRQRIAVCQAGKAWFVVNSPTSIWTLTAVEP